MCSLTLLFFNFSAGEIGLILFVALILFGGDKFPEIARGLGRGLREFKDMSDNVKRELHEQINNHDQARVSTPVANTEPQVAQLTTETPLPAAEDHFETIVNPTHQTVDTPVIHEVKQDQTL